MHIGNTKPEAVIAPGSAHESGLFLESRVLMIRPHYKRFIADERTALAQEFRDALNASTGPNPHHGLRLEYQPLIDITNNKLAGFEALLRWTTKANRVVSPLDAVDLAKRFGLSEALDRWVLQTAVAQIAEWLAQHADLVLSINLTEALLRHPHCTTMVEYELNRHSVPARNFCIEVTETVLLDQTALANLHNLKKIGVQLSLDDFGTGKSALSRLMELPVDNVKLDRSFIIERDLTKQDEAFLKAVVEMALARGATTTIEGVCRLEHLELASRIGCTTCQGFWFSPAVPAQRATSMLTESVNTWACAGRA